MQETTIQEHPDSLVVKFREVKILDDTVIAQIGKELIEVASTLPEDKTLALNFEGVLFMSSAMIGKLVLVHKKTKAEGKKMILYNISSTVLDVFKLTRLDKIFKIHDDFEPAAG